ncbi:MAG: toprim domain-containing protein [Armatimonadota bacterium]
MKSTRGPRRSRMQGFGLKLKTGNEPDVESSAQVKKRLELARPVHDSPAERYLLDRGLPLGEVRLADVLYAPRWSDIGEASVFRIRDTGGETVAAFGRALQGDGKRTFGPKKLGVFATPGALGSEILIVTEAPIDAMSLSSCGWPAIALCGTTAPDWLRSAAIRRTVFLATDSDKAGEDAASELQKQLGRRCNRLRPVNKDWNADLIAIGRPAMAAELSRVLGELLPSLTCPVCRRRDWRYSYPSARVWCGACSEPEEVGLHEDDCRPANIIELRRARAGYAKIEEFMAEVWQLTISDMEGN